MKVLYVATEVSPFIKVGGLGDVAGSLPLELHKMGIDIRVAVPKYKTLNVIPEKMAKIGEFGIIFNWKKEKVKIYEAHLPEVKVPVYFFENENHLSGGGDYFSGHHKERIDRFVFFSKAVSEWLKINTWQPDIIHVNDWHPSLILVLSKNIKKILTIHNHASNEFPTLGSLRYLLSYPASEFPEIVHRRSGVVNLLLSGITHADFVNAVSKTYASEITKRRFCGKELADAFSEKEENGTLTGILNGIDTKMFDPKRDLNLVKNYSVNDWEKGKTENKKKLLKLAGFEDNGEPLLGFVARFTPQKGIDLLLKAIRELKDGFRMVILGTGSEEIMKEVRGAVEKNPKKYAAFLKFDDGLASLIYGGSDMFLVPSRFEPCGLTQMIAMRYGSVPIVRRTGGLSDTVFEGKNGFVFAEYRVRSLERAIRRACEAFKDKVIWKKLVESGMKEDFGWEKSAKKYLEMYEKILN